MKRLIDPPSPDVEAIAARTLKLSPPDRLRLAAELLEERKPQLAHAIAKHVVDELGLALFLAGRS